MNAWATPSRWLHAASLVAAIMFAPLVVHAAEPIVIGESLPMGGADDGSSARTVAGAEAYIELVNAAGGVRGRPIKLITLDDGGDPKRHADNLRRLAQENNAVAFINCLGDASCAAAADMARQVRIPLVGPLSGAQGLSRAANPYVFRIRAPYLREAEALAKQLLAVGTLSVAIVTDSRTPSEPVQSVQEALGRSKIKSTVMVVDPNSEASFKKLMTGLGASRFQAVFLDIHADTFSQLGELKLEKRDEWPLVLTTFASGNSNSFLNAFSNRMLGSTSVVPNPELAAIPLARELQQQAERSSGGSALTYAGMESYINTRVCVEAMRRVEGNKVDAHSVLAALNALGTLDVGGFILTFSPGAPSASDWVDIVVRSRTGYLLK